MKLTKQHTEEIAKELQLRHDLNGNASIEEYMNYKIGVLGRNDLAPTSYMYHETLEYITSISNILKIDIPKEAMDIHMEKNQIYGEQGDIWATSRNKTKTRNSRAKVTKNALIKATGKVVPVKFSIDSIKAASKDQ